MRAIPPTQVVEGSKKLSGQKWRNHTDMFRPAKEPKKTGDSNQAPKNFNFYTQWRESPPTQVVKGSKKLPGQE